MKVCFFTLGCKVNQQETGALQELFSQNGYTICGEEETADIYIVNSCTVTASGDKKSMQWLRRAKRDNPQAVTVLTGCYPQAFPKEAAGASADIIVGNTSRRAVLESVERFLGDGRHIFDVVPYCGTETFEELPASHLAGHTRAFLKIEDGCNRFCSYCIIPYARGRVRSRSEASILAEMKSLAESGVREFVLSGINLSCYGTDSKTDLAKLIVKAAQLDGVERIRLGSIEPDLLPDEMLERLSRVPELCPQFHLSLQSGCDATLQRMNRKYRCADYERVVGRLRTLFDHPALTTDVIVGFPGETDADFEESLRFVQKCRFLKVHVFSYSPRPGTPAATMPDPVSEAVKAQRSRRLTAVAEAVREEVIGGYCGAAAEVLLEKPCAPGIFTGYTKRYIPVYLAAPDRRQGEIVPVVLGPFENGRCRADLTR